MQDTYHNRPLNKTPNIFITSYTVENELIFQPAEHQPECKHTYKYQYLETNPDVKIARNKAFVKLLEEASEMQATRHLMAHPDQPYLDLKLYFEYQSVEKNKTDAEPEVQRFYILDGKPFNKKLLLERLAEELFFLMRSGAEFDSTFFQDDDGQDYEVVEMDGRTDFCPFLGLYTNANS